MTLEEHVEEFKSEWFSVFKNFISRERVAEIRAVLDPEFDILFAKMPEAPRYVRSSAYSRDHGRSAREK